jgi:hypothetical protein
MNLTSPILKGAAHAADLPGDSVTSLLKLVADSTGFLADDRPDGVLGMLMSGLAGVAAALAVAIMLTVYFRSGHRSARDIFGINPTKPAVEFEIRMPKSAASTAADTQVELHTDRNQTLAQVQGALASSEDGRSVLRGSVPLDYRTRDRVVILNLPGQAQCQFKLRLAANPSHSDQFGPWHLADRVASGSGEETRAEQNDAFAIRYRVL